MDKLQFNPVVGWANKIEFPNYQDENSNREMMNRLHFQTRDFINNLITLLESTDGATQIGSYAIEGLTNLDSSEATTVKAQLEALKRLVDTKSASVDVYTKDESYSQSEVDTIAAKKANSSEVYSKTDIDSKVNMSSGAIASINSITNPKGNISIIAGAGIRIEVDNTSKAIRVISTGTGTGDMLKEQYDADGDGIVDDAKKLGGKSADSYYNLGVPNKNVVANTSIHDYTDEGRYYIGNNVTPTLTDLPPSLMGINSILNLTVEKITSSRIRQTITRHNNETYWCTGSIGGEFNDWQRVAYTDNISNPNLLINGDFRINQRGLSSYTGSGYGVDMWKVQGDSTTITEVGSQYDGYIKVQQSVGATAHGDAHGILQWIEGYYGGKVVTISLNVDDVEYSETFTMNTSTYNVKVIDNELFYLDCGSSNTNKKGLVELKFKDTSEHTIRYIKLELGNVATPLSPRPYGEELALCQRYYLPKTRYIFVSASASNNQLYGCVSLPCNLRVHPTIVSCSIGSIRGNSSVVDVANAQVIVHIFQGNTLMLGIFGITNAINTPYTVTVDLEFSCEL